MEEPLDYLGADPELEDEPIPTLVIIFMIVPFGAFIAGVCLLIKQVFFE